MCIFCTELRRIEQFDAGLSHFDQLNLHLEQKFLF
jgi:hypothetical protein